MDLQSCVFHLFREGRAVGITLLWIAFITNVVAVNFLAVWLPTLITSMGMAVRIAAWAAVGFHVGSIVGAVLLGKLADLRGAYRVLPTNLATGAVIVWLAGLAGSSSSLVLALSFGMGFCIAGGQFGLGILSSGYYPTYIRATGVAWAADASWKDRSTTLWLMLTTSSFARSRCSVTTLAQGVPPGC